MTIEGKELHRLNKIMKVIPYVNKKQLYWRRILQDIWPHTVPGVTVHLPSRLSLDDNRRQRVAQTKQNNESDSLREQEATVLA